MALLFVFGLWCNRYPIIKTLTKNIKSMKNNNLKIEYVAIADLKLSEYNPRKHTPEAMTALKESITVFEFLQRKFLNIGFSSEELDSIFEI